MWISFLECSLTVHWLLVNDLWPHWILWVVLVCCLQTANAVSSYCSYSVECSSTAVMFVMSWWCHYPIFVNIKTIVWQRFNFSVTKMFLKLFAVLSLTLILNSNPLFLLFESNDQWMGEGPKRPNQCQTDSPWAPTLLGRHLILVVKEFFSVNQTSIIFSTVNKKNIASFIFQYAFLSRCRTSFLHRMQKIIFWMLSFYVTETYFLAFFYPITSRSRSLFSWLVNALLTQKKMLWKSNKKLTDSTLTKFSIIAKKKNLAASFICSKHQLWPTEKLLRLLCRYICIANVTFKDLIRKFKRTQQSMNWIRVWECKALFHSE